VAPVGPERIPLAEAGPHPAAAAMAPRPVPAHKCGSRRLLVRGADYDPAAGASLPSRGGGRRPPPRSGRPRASPCASSRALVTGGPRHRSPCRRTCASGGGWPHRVAIPAGLKRVNVRKAGEDVKAGRLCWRRARCCAAGPGSAGIAGLWRGGLLPAVEGRDRLDRRRGATRRSGWRESGGGHVFDANAPMLGLLIAAPAPWQPTWACFPTTWRR
jgi:hypothetical protein